MFTLSCIDTLICHIIRYYEYCVKEKKKEKANWMSFGSVLQRIFNATNTKINVKFMKS